MASTITSKEYTGNGSLKTFTYTFQSYQEEDVKVKVNETDVTNFTIPNYAASGGTVTFNNTGVNASVCESDGSPKNGLIVRVYRDTDITAGSVGEYEPKATYQAGSSIKAADLNNNAKQALYAAFEVKDQEIQESKIRDGAVTSAKIKDGTIVNDDIANTTITGGKLVNDTITATQIAADAIGASELADNSVASANIINETIMNADINPSADIGFSKLATLDSGKIIVGNSSNVAAGVAVSGDVTLSNTGAVTIATGAVEHAMLANDCIDADNIQDNALKSEHYTDNSIQRDHLEADIINANKIADGQISTEHYVVDSIQHQHLQNDVIDGDNIQDDAVGEEHIKANAIKSEHYTNNSIQRDHLEGDIIDATKIADGQISTEHYVVDSIQHAHLQNDVIDADNIQDDAVKSEHLLDHASDDSQRAVTTNHIKDNAITFAKIGCEETTLTTNSNTAIPTSKAVADHVANVVDSVGGFKIIANKDSFPEAHPDPKGDAGMVISVTDPAGFVVNGSGVSTTGDTITSDGTVTINGFPSDVHSTTTTSNYTLLLQTTSTAHTYDFYRFLAKDADVLNLSSDIEDFGNRYRTGANRTANNSNTNHDGDLFFDQSANKMYVYDGAYDSGGAWKEVTSTGEFKILTLEDTDGSPFDGANQSFNLKDGSNAASVDQPGQLIVSVNGVIQKPNAGTSAPSEGFALVDSDTIIFGAAPGSGASVFVTQCGSAVTLNVPADDSVTAAKLNAGTETTGHFLSKTASGSGIAWAAVPAGVGGATGVDFNDGIKARWGTSNDAEIFLDGTTTDLQIKCVGIGGMIDFLSKDGFKFAVDSNDVVEIDADSIDTRSEIRFTEAIANGNAYVGIKSPTDKGSDASYTITLPSAAPASNGQALTATTAGVASWASVSSTVANGCIYENDNEITSDHTIASDKGAHSVGPITVSATVTVNGNWVVS